MRNYILSFFSIFCIILFIGCLGGSNTGNQDSDFDTEIRSSVISVDQSGRLKFESPYSNLVIEASDEQTFDKNVEVMLIEKSAEKTDSSVFDVASKIYSISAYLTHNGVRTSDVKNVEPPITIKIPKPIEENPGSMNYYIGFREWSKAAWQYAFIGDCNGNSETLYVASQRAAVSDGNYFVIQTRNVFCEFALFSESKSKPANLSCRVSNISITASPKDIVLTQLRDKNDKLLLYDSDIIVSICIQQDNEAFSFSPISCKLESLISFSSESQIFPENLKINDGNIQFTNIVSSTYKESSGNKFLHTVSLEVPIESVTSNIATFSFKIGTKWLSIADFPTIFTVKSTFIPAQTANKASVPFTKEADFNREIISGMVLTNLQEKADTTFAPTFKYYGHALNSFKIVAVNKTASDTSPYQVKGQTNWDTSNNTLTFIPTTDWEKDTAYAATATVRCCEAHSPQSLPFSFVTNNFKGSGTANDPYLFSIVSPTISEIIPVNINTPLVIDPKGYNLTQRIYTGSIAYLANSLSVENSPIENVSFTVSDGKLTYTPTAGKLWVSGKSIQATATINLTTSKIAVAGTFIFKTRTEAIELEDPTKPNDIDNPYLVKTASQLASIGKEDYPSGYFKQANDINMSDVTQTTPDATAPNEFYGYYDGNNYTVTQARFPLFENLKGIVKNLTVTNANININGPVGVIAMRSTGGEITNVKINNSTVSSLNDDCGSFIGKVTPTSSTTITNCSAEHFVLNGLNVGCFIGSAENASLSLENNVCGIHGNAHPQTSNQYMTGNLTATPTVTIVPPDGTTNFGVSQAIVLTFNKPMNVNTITQLTLQFSPTVSYTTNWDSEKRVLTILHGSPLENGRTYHLSMAPNTAKDIFGAKSLASPITNSFTTESESTQTYAFVEILEESKILNYVNYKPKFIIHFSRAMREDAKDAVSICKNSETITSGVEKTWSDDRTSLAIDINTALQTGEEYFISINSPNAIDINNNELATFHNYGFTVYQFAGTGKIADPLLITSGDFSPIGVISSSTAALNLKLPFDDFGSIQNSSTVTYENGAKTVAGTFTSSGKTITFIPNGHDNNYWAHDKAISVYAYVVCENENRTMKIGPINFRTPLFTTEDPTKASSRTNPYLIYTKAQLESIRDNNSLYMGNHFKQVRDISLAETVWAPIGNASYAFTGSYDGNSMTISDLKSYGMAYAGLFGKTNSAKLFNINLKLDTLTGTTNIGGIVAYAIQTEISNNKILSGVINSGTAQHAGCIAGYTENCNIYGNECNIHTHLSDNNDYLLDNLSEPLTIVSTLPANNVTNVSLLPEVVINFSKPVLESSITASSLYFSPSVNYTKTWNDTKTVLTLMPTTALDARTRYTIYLVANLIQDLYESKKLSSNSNVTFTTQAAKVYAEATVEPETSSVVLGYINYLPIFKISFNIAMNESSINAITLQKGDVIINDVEKTWNLAKSAIEMKVTSPLEQSATYKLVIDNTLALDTLGDNMLPFAPQTYTTYSLKGTGVVSDPFQINSGYEPSGTVKSLVYPISFIKPTLDPCDTKDYTFDVSYSTDEINYTPIEGSIIESGDKVIFTPNGDDNNYWPPNKNIYAKINFKCCNKNHSMTTNTPIHFTTPMLGLQNHNALPGESNPYLIYTKGQLKAIGDANSDTGGNDLDCHYKQVRNLILTGEHIPIGTSSEPFTGYYDGNSFTITGLTCSTRRESSGLFGYNSGTLNNIKLTASSIKNADNSGCIAGTNAGTITNCKVNGVNNIIAYAGGNSGCIVGSNSGELAGNICESHTHINNEQNYMAGNISLQPQIINIEPTNGSTEVNVNQSFVISFNKPIDTTAFKPESIVLSPNDAEFDDSIEWNENKTQATLSLKNDLLYDSNYSISIPASSIKDTFAGITGTNFSSSFHTRTTGEQPTATVTVANSDYITPTEISYKSTFIIDFSKSMKDSAINSAKLTYDGGVEFTNTSKTWSNENKKLTISLTSPLKNNTEYKIEINRELARDTVNLSLDGNNEFAFKTFIFEGLGNTTDPFKVNQSIATITVPLNLKEAISFEKPEFKTACSGSVSGTVTYSYTGSGEDTVISCDYSKENDIYKITPKNTNNDFWQPNTTINASIDLSCCNNHKFKINEVIFPTPMFSLSNPKNTNSASNRYEIYTAEQLAALSERGSYTGTNDLACFYKQVRNIDLLPVSPFTPIGTEEAPFTGQYDGGNFSITNLDNTPTGEYGGLFGCVSGGTIDNIKLSALTISGSKYAGGFIGYLKNNGKLRNSTLNSGATIVRRSNDTGCIIGKNDTGTLSSVSCMLSGHNHDSLLDAETYNYKIGNLGLVPEVVSVKTHRDTNALTEKINLDDKIVLTFNKPMDNSTITNSVLTINNGSNVNYSTQWNDSKTVLTISPSASLVYDSVYTLTIAANQAKDYFKYQKIENEYSCSITTTDVGINADAIANIDGTNLINDEPICKPEIVITFTKEMNASANEYVKLWQNTNEIPISKTWDNNSNPKKLTIVPTNNLATSTVYTLKIDSMNARSKDNLLINNFSDYTFTTYKYTGNGTNSDPVSVISDSLEDYSPRGSISSSTEPIIFTIPFTHEDISEISFTPSGSVNVNDNGITSSIDGTFTFISPNKIKFTPNTAWPFNTTFNVSISNFKCCSNDKHYFSIPKISLTSSEITLFDPSSSHSPSNPYLIYTENQLLYVKNHIDKAYRLMNNFNLENVNSGVWVPIGTKAAPFTGIFDGNGFTLSNLSFTGDDSENSYASIFGYGSGTINNLSVTVKSIQQVDYGAGIACIWSAPGVIYNCSVSGTDGEEENSIKAKKAIGGIVASSSAEVSYCSFNGGCKLHLNESQVSYVGGIIGIQAPIAQSLTNNSITNLTIESESNLTKQGCLIGYCANAGLLELTANTCVVHTHSTQAELINNYEPAP